MGLDELNKRIEKAKKEEECRIQNPEDFKDLDLLVGGEDILRVQRTNHPECCPESFLFIRKGKKNLILWGTGYGGGERCGRVIKLPLEEVSFGQPLMVPDYKCNKFFGFNEKTYTMLHDAGMIY